MSAQKNKKVKLANDTSPVVKIKINNENADIESFAKIRVIGVGGSGGNAVNHMVQSKVAGVDFIVANTDAQDLKKSRAKKKITLGKIATKGLGTGMNAEIGRMSADEARDEITESLKGSDMIFVTCGMGGGTGTGAAPAIAKIARELGALTIAVVTKPFSFEGKHRGMLASQGTEELKKEVDALITIPNDRLMASVGRDTGLRSAFAMCDDVLKQAVEGISDLITTPGIINVDFADIRSVMQSAGSALMGIGIATGENRAKEAAEKAINSPLLDVSIAGATGVLFAVAGGDDLTMIEVQEAATTITQSADPEAKIIFGAIQDDSLRKGAVKVTVIATGFPQNNFIPKPLPSFSSVVKSESKENFPFVSDKPSTEIREKIATKPQPPKQDNTDNDSWSAIPSFLRHSKLK